MIPDDPLGRNGPHLDTFLHKDSRYVFFPAGYAFVEASAAVNVLHRNFSHTRSPSLRSPATSPPLRPPDFRPPSQQQQPAYVQAIHSTPQTPTSTHWPPPSLMPHPTTHWPHSGPPEWHPPRRSPSPSPSPPPQRSAGETSELKQKLYDIFPDQKQRIDRILNDNPYMRDLNALSGLLLG